MKLYRTARTKSEALLPSGFWSTDPEYAQYIHLNWPLWEAELPSSAHIYSDPIGNLSRRSHATSVDRKTLFTGLIDDDYDAAVFSAWDWPCDEVVVFNPTKLMRLKRRG